MHLSIAIALSVHVLAGVFWAGSTFALARNGYAGADKLRIPQLMAAALVIGSGGYLWITLHQGQFGRMETSLSIGAASAVGALIVQISSGFIRAREVGGAGRSSIGVRLNGISAGLLAVATVAMAAARLV